MKQSQFSLRVTRASIAGLLTVAISIPSALHAEPQHHASIDRTQKIARPPSQVAGTLKVARSQANKQTTILVWTGPIFRPMAKQFERAIEENKSRSTRFLLQLNSPGGSVSEAEKVIALLRNLKETHRVDTLVRAGWTCGSMCPFIYAQGENRYAAPASMWLFHEILYSDPKTGKPMHLERQRWLGLIDDYFVPAGLSESWLDKMKTIVKSRDLYVSGDSLLRNKAGLITKHIPDVLERNIPTAPQG